MALMPNVSFEIFRDNVSLGIFKTDEFGEILLVNQPAGSYRIEERHTGDDEHLLDPTPQYVELKAGMGIVALAVMLVRNEPWVDLMALGLTLVISHLGLLFWEMRYVSATLAFPGLKPTTEKVNA